MISASEDLVNDLRKTGTDVDELVPHVQKLDAMLTSVVTQLQKVKGFDDEVTELDDNLGTSSSVLAAMSVLPTVGSACSTAKKGVDVTKKGVHPVRQVSNKVEKAAKPVREAAAKAEKKVAQAEKKLKQLKSQTAQLANRLECVYNCGNNNSLPAVTDACDEFSSTVDPVVEGLNTTLEQTTSAFVEVENYLAQIDDALLEMTRVQAAFDPVFDVLGEIDVAFDAIRKVLNKKIKVPYDVKFKVKVKVKKKEWWKVFYVWEWKWKTRTEYFTFSVQQIINGINTGIAWVNDQLMKLAKQALSALGIKMPEMPSIPGLSQLEIKFRGLLDIFPKVEAGFGDIEVDLDNLFSLVSTLNLRLAEFDVKCKGC